MVESQSAQSDSRFEFRYQRDHAFHALLERGIGNELSNSSYCWAASTDMALSPFVPSHIRLEIIINAAQQINNEPEAFGPKGDINLDKLDSFVHAVNTQLEKQKFEARLKLKEKPKLTDYHEEIERGNMVIFTIGEKSEKHVMVMDRILQDGGVYYYSAWDPNAESACNARMYFDNLDMEQLQLYPLIISVGVEAMQN